MANHKPKAIWEKGAMSPLDQYVIFCLVRRPIEEVTGAIAGVMRTSYNGAVVVAGEKRPPSVADTNKKGRLSVHPACLVSASPSSGVTLVETSSFHSKGTDLSKMLPDCEVFQFATIYETAHRWRHAMSVMTAGNCTRMMVVDKGFGSSRPKFEQAGEPKPFEDTARYALSDVTERCDRALILSYAAKVGLSLRDHLYERDLSESTYFRGYCHM